MLATILKFGPPIVLVIAMLGVGMSMTRRSLVPVARQPGRLAIVTLAQMILLPVIGVITILLVDPPVPIAAAFLLIAICPGGGLSNLYVFFAGASVSLSVIMTLVSILFANITIPIAAAVTTSLGFETAASRVPFTVLVSGLLSTILLPIILGMILRSIAPAFAAVWTVRLRSLSILMVLAILLSVLWLDRTAVAATISVSLFAAAIFLVQAFVAGWIVGWLVYRNSTDNFAVMTEFAVRNLIIGTFLAIGLEDDVSFAGPAALYLVLEAICAFALGTIYRARDKSIAAPAE